jgi:oxygen-independent coproporphyrinogen-3 oxidase
MGRDFRARHNLAYWLGRDYLGLGIGAVSTIEGLRWRNAPPLAEYVASLAAGHKPPRELEPLDGEVRARERLLLGLRLDEPLPLTSVAGAIDRASLERLARLDLVRIERGRGDEHEALTLTPRGRALGGGVTAELLA